MFAAKLGQLFCEAAANEARPDRKPMLLATIFNSKK